MRVSLNLGASFAELYVNAASPTVTEQGPLHAKCYLPQVPIRELLKRHLRPLNPDSPFEIRVCLRSLEKIFGTRLGGSVAQITTAGFESWFYSRQSQSAAGLGAHLKKKDSIGEPDLVFAVKERMDAQGRVVTPLDPQELATLAEKLKKRDVKKICIHFINSYLNPTHVQSASAFLRESGFEVFSSLRAAESLDEISSWRTNILNACLSGTFNEIDRDLRASFHEIFPELFTGPEAVPILYLNSEGQFEKSQSQNLTGVLLGWTSLLSKQTHLYLGLEKWCYSPQKFESVWKSPWGEVEVPHRSFRNLTLQPTSLIELQTHDEIGWGDEVGFEPGPISFGRSAKFCIFDFLNLKVPALREAMSSIVPLCENDKLLAPLHLLGKTSQKANFAEIFFKKILDSLVLQAPIEDLQIEGFWAPILENSLRSQFPHLQLRFLNSGNSEVLRVASLDTLDARSL